MPKTHAQYRHSREGGNPDPLPKTAKVQAPNWIPAFAGMTELLA
jgi:hypothetical protein